MTMKIGQFLDMLIEEPNTIIVVYPNGYEEEYEDFPYEADHQRVYVRELKFESCDIYEQDGRKVMKAFIWEK